MIFLKYYFSNIVYFLLFPFCFIYLVLTSLMVIPPFMGGYYSIMSTIVVIPLLFWYLIFTFPVIRQSIINDFLFFIFIFYYSAIVIVNYGSVNPQILTDNLANIVYLTSTFFVFRSIKIDSKIFYKLNTYFFILMSVTVIFLSKAGVFMLVVDHASFINNEVSYQFIAVIYIFSFIIVLSRQYAWYLRYALYVAAMLVLFLNGARSEFIGVIMIIPLLEIVKSKNRLLAISVSIIFLVGIVSILYTSRDSLGTGNRTVELLRNTTQNASTLSRDNMTDNALNIIDRNPLMGSYGSYDRGSYAHNILSVWVDLGIIGFILYCSLLITPLLYVSYLMILKKNISEILVVLMCLIYISVLLVIFAKSISYVLPPAVFGLFSNYLSRFKLKIQPVNGNL